MVEVIVLILIPIIAFIASTIYIICIEIKKNREGKMAKYVGLKIGDVHESHVVSEYYCGGCGWPVTDHDSFCSECGGAFHKCDADNENISRLEAENKKLRKMAEKYIRQAYLLACEKGNPIIKGIIMEDAHELGIHV